MSALIWEASWTFCLKKKTLVRKKLQVFILSSLLRDSLQISFFYLAVIGNCMFATFLDTSFLGLLPIFGGDCYHFVVLLSFATNLHSEFLSLVSDLHESKCTVHIMGFLERSTMDTEIIKLSNYNENLREWPKPEEAIGQKSVIARITNANKRALL